MLFGWHIWNVTDVAQLCWSDEARLRTKRLGVIRTFIVSDVDSRGVIRISISVPCKGSIYAKRFLLLWTRHVFVLNNVLFLAPERRRRLGMFRYIMAAWRHWSIDVVEVFWVGWVTTWRCELGPILFIIVLLFLLFAFFVSVFVLRIGLIRIQIRIAVAVFTCPIGEWLLLVHFYPSVAKNFNQGQTILWVIGE